MTPKQTRRARIARLRRWFPLAAEREKLIRPWPTSKAALARLARFDDKHPEAGLITTAFLYDLFLLATERDQ